MSFFVQYSQELLLFSSLVLVIIVIKLYTSGGRSMNELLEQVQKEQSSQIEHLFEKQQKAIDDKFMRSQSMLFESTTNGRESQLRSLEELRLTLEKRFSDTEGALNERMQSFNLAMVERFEQLKLQLSSSIYEGHENLSKNVNQLTEKNTQNIQDYQRITTSSLTDNVRKGMQDIKSELASSTKQQNETVGNAINNLSETTDKRLLDISQQVEKRLSDGFEKTNQTFSDVVKRLALIDDAQKKITELSSNVVSLQEILNDKRSRGAFGEVQLQSLVSNIMPDSHYQMQYKLDNDKVADCILTLPEPTGRIAIDAKFPLESYKKMTDIANAEVDRASAAKQFSKDIKKHISDIAHKYILPPQTADGAVMFIPAESVFAEIHGHYPELVEYAYASKVWLVSPTTLMAILTTATAVIKDEQTRKQVHIIKEHLAVLGKDFGRFQSRMDKLSSHIGQVSKDVDMVHVSAKKITSRFEKIERVEMTSEETLNLSEPTH